MIMQHLEDSSATKLRFAENEGSFDLTVEATEEETATFSFETEEDLSWLIEQLQEARADLIRQSNLNKDA